MGSARHAGPDSERLDRLIAHGLGWTRSAAQKAIRRCRVTIDDVWVRDPATKVAPKAQVKVEDRVVPRLDRTVLMMNKQAGSVSANVDASERTVMEDLPEPLRRDDLRIVGRLDKDTTGLLLLTNDGDLLHRLTHPRHGIEKTYGLTFEGTLDGDSAARFEAGLTLDDGTQCAPAHITFTGPDAAEVLVHEGKYHQVKRMIAAIGGRVITLERTRMGPLVLDADLQRGQTRPLTEGEIEALDQAVSPSAGVAGSSPGHRVSHERRLEDGEQP